MKDHDALANVTRLLRALGVVYADVEWYDR